MKNQNIRFLVLVAGLLLLFQASAFPQNQSTIIVQDESGSPIAGATVFTGENSKAVYTNEKGEFSLPSGRNTKALVEADGFESQLLPITGVDKIILTKKPYQLGEKDKTYVPFGELSRRKIAGSVSVVDPKEILSYDEAGNVSGILNGRISGLFGSSNIRGFGTPLYVINGIPRQSLDINPYEIDQITVIKDVSAAMLYGSQAKNGVILITTRHGAPFKKEINFAVESGVNIPISYPSYLPAADYMELYNEALANDGLDDKYSQVQIDSTRSGLNPVRFPDEDYYNSSYLKNMNSYRNFRGQVMRGNENGQFVLNIGWEHSDGWLKVGEGANEKHDRLSMRSGIDYEVNDIISLDFDASIVFDISQEPRFSDGNFWNVSTTTRPDLFPVLIPSSLITDESLLKTAKLIQNKYVLGGTSEYLSSAYGDMIFNDLSRSYERLVEMNTGLKFDLNSIVKGLTARTHLFFDIYNSFSEQMNNSYAVYQPNYTGDVLTSFTKLGTDTKVHTRSVVDGSYNRKYGFYGTFDYQRTFGDHEVNATAIAYVDEYSVEGVRQPLKHGHLGLRADYMYKNKYIAELTGVYAISGKLMDTKNAYSFSPGIGLGWILTEEDFLSDNSLINYLKLRANWALLNTDENISDYNLARNYYTASGSYPFRDGAYSNSGRRVYRGNTNLGWEKVSNMSVGFEAVLLDKRLEVDGSYFYNKNFDIVTRRDYNLPEFFGNLPYENYGSNQTQGVELGLQHKIISGDFEFNIGGNLIYSVPKLLAANELKYPDEYRRTVGLPTDAYFGYVAEGLFKDQQDIDDHAVQTFGTVKSGDIKYKDLNGDDFIDENDQMMIGHSNARLGYGINLRLKYKGFEIFALGTGQTGADRYFTSSYYWVYGDRKYSEVVLDRWTPETAEVATYPRLSTTQSANNFRNSTFWLYRNNWFELQTVQLTYTLTNLNFIGINEVRVFTRGTNLAKLSAIREKTDLNIGSTPQARTVSLGLNVRF